MSDSDWPEAKIVYPAKWPYVARQLNDATVLDLEKKIVAECGVRITPATTRLDRVRFAWEKLEEAAKIFIPRADEFLRSDGPEKKQLVRGELLRVLKLLEARVDILPAMLEPLAWKGIEWGLGRLIDSMHARLEAAGSL
jgi:hypothetical protein